VSVSPARVSAPAKRAAAQRELDLSRIPELRESIDELVGGQIKRLRRLRGLTQAALGLAIGLTDKQVQKLEAGSNQLTTRRLRAVATALNVPVGALFSRQDERRSTRGSDATSDGVADLVRAFRAIGDPEVRDQALRLVRALARDYPLPAAPSPPIAAAPAPVVAPAKGRARDRRRADRAYREPELALVAMGATTTNER
jgi:transcriptional regulator with XRE-family HTH domain